MNKSSTSVDVLLLEYSIFLALSVRSDVAEMVMDREFLRISLKPAQCSRIPVAVLVLIVI